MTKRPWKAAEEKWCKQDKNSSVRSTAEFSSETMKAIRQWDDIHKVLKVGGGVGWGTVYQEFYTQKKILYAAFKNKGKIKTCPDKEELRVCHSADLTYQKYQGSSSGWNENLLHRNLNAHEEIKMCKGKYIGKYKRQFKCIFSYLI